MHADIVNIIFGLKVRQARMEAGLSLSELAARSDLSPSYVTEIEKGRKYPKPDKILKMAQALNKPYDEMVSIQLDPAWQHLETVLSSPLLREFPFEEFDIDINDLTSLLTRTPDKASALLHAIVEIARQYDMKDEHFLRAALRSYQELNDNYFPDLEATARDFAARYGLDQSRPIPLEQLRSLLIDAFGYTIDETTIARMPVLTGYRAVFFDTPRRHLLLNSALSPMQTKFLLARELGYASQQLTLRSRASTPDQVESFQQVFNDFKAAYFAGALLMPAERVVADLRTLFAEPAWRPELLLRLLPAYEVTPEMLLYRFSELIPQFFGIKLHFLRFHHVNGDYKLIKRLNMNNLLLPSGIGLYEHYCRRWLSSHLLIELRKAQEYGRGDAPIAGAQVSQYFDSNERFLCIGFARPLALAPTVGSSVIVGFRVTPTLHETIAFVNDPTIHHTTINGTCERCPLTPEQCTVRGAPPLILREQRRKHERRAAIQAIQDRLSQQTS